MNPGIGGPELLVLVILAIVVVGPKELPLMVRRIGQMIGRVRGVAREFQRSFDELGREAEMAELRKEVEALKAANPVNDIKREFEAARDDALSEVATHAETDRPHPRTAKAPSNDEMTGEPVDFSDATPAQAATPSDPVQKSG